MSRTNAAESQLTEHTSLKPMRHADRKDAVQAKLALALADAMDRHGVDGVELGAEIGTDKVHVCRCRNPLEPHTMNGLHIVLMCSSRCDRIRAVGLDMLRATAELCGAAIDDMRAGPADPVAAAREVQTESAEAMGAHLALIANPADAAARARAAREHQDAADVHQRCAIALRGGA